MIGVEFTTFYLKQNNNPLRHLFCLINFINTILHLLLVKYYFTFIISQELLLFLIIKIYKLK